MVIRWDRKREERLVFWKNLDSGACVQAPNWGPKLEPARTHGPPLPVRESVKATPLGHPCFLPSPPSLLLTYLYNLSVPPLFLACHGGLAHSLPWASRPGLTPCGVGVGVGEACTQPLRALLERCWGNGWQANTVEWEAMSVYRLTLPRSSCLTHLPRGQGSRKVQSWPFPTFCGRDQEGRVQGRRGYCSPFQRTRVAGKNNWGVGACMSPVPEPSRSRTDPRSTRAPVLLAKKRVKLWPSGKWKRVGPATPRRKPEGPSPRGGEEHSGSRKPARRAAGAAPSAAGAGVWSLFPAWRLLAQGSCGPGRGRGSWPQRHLLQRAFDKEPFPPWVSRALLASGTFSAELFRGGARPWSARARARGPGLGAALAPQARAGDHPGTRVLPRAITPLPTAPTKGRRRRPGRWWALSPREGVCPRVPAPPAAGAPSASNPARARRAPGASSCFRRESTLSRRSLHPASAAAPRATSKHVQCHSRAGKEQLESLPSPKSALPRPSRTPKRQQHLPTTFHAQALRSPPEHAKSRPRPANLVPSGWVHAPAPAPHLAGVGRTVEPRCP